MHNGGRALMQSSVDNRNQDYMKKHTCTTVSNKIILSKENNLQLPLH